MLEIFYSAEHLSLKLGIHFNYTININQEQKSLHFPIYNHQTNIHINDQTNIHINDQTNIHINHFFSIYTIMRNNNKTHTIEELYAKIDNLEEENKRLKARIADR